MKTVIDLMREYVRVAYMVEAYNKKHGTDIKPWECVKYADVVFNYHPNFNWGVHKYEFAVAILEGKPVFAGDAIYDKRCGSEVIVTGFDGDAFLIKYEDCEDWLNHEHCTSIKPTPKRTFTLNGVELPCPVVDRLDEDYALNIGGNFIYWFRSREDRDSVVSAINDLLLEARDSHD